MACFCWSGLHFGILALLCCSSFLVVTTGGMNTLKLVLFSKEYSNERNARCLDGSPAGFYWAKGLQANKWTIFLEGGGLCLTHHSCKSRSMTKLGSSSLWSNSTQGFSLTSAFESQNPTFYSWNHVFIPYCSGDLWSGTVTKPSPSTFDFYFSGHLNLVAVLDYLMKNHGLGNDTSNEVVFAGESAGGVGVLNNVDFVASKLFQSGVVGVPIGGWYYPKVSVYPSWLIHVNLEIGSIVPYELYRSYVNENCASSAGDKPWLCGPVSATVLYPHVKTPLFVVENMFDADQIHDQLQCPKENDTHTNSYMLYYGDQMREAMTEVILSPKNDGVFMPSCLDHTDNLVELTESSTVQGRTVAQALDDWYEERVPSVHLVDSCHFVNCEPSCLS